MAENPPLIQGSSPIHHPECMTDVPAEASLGVWDCHADCPQRARQAPPNDQWCVGCDPDNCCGCGPVIA